MKHVLAYVLMLALMASPFAASYNVTRSGAFFDSGFTLNGLLQTPDRVYPGDEVQLRFNVVNTQSSAVPGVILDVLTPFLTEQTQMNLGDLTPQVPKEVVLNFVVPNDTKPGSYYLFLYATSKLASQAQIAQIPIVINEPLLSNALMANLDSLSAVYTGTDIDLPVEIRNVGVRDVTDVTVQMVFSSSNAITPIGSDRVYIPAIAFNGSQTAHFKVGINPSAVAGFYPVTLLMSYKVDKALQPTMNQTFGVKVVSKTALLVTSDTSASATSTSTAASGAISPTVVITVANVGDTTLRGVYVSASSSDYAFTGTSDKFIGTLNLDDSASLSLSVVPKIVAGASPQPGAMAAPSSGTIDVRVSYKDDLNVEHVQTQSVPVRRSAAATGVGSFANGNGNQRFGQRSQGFTIFGIQPLYLGLLLVAAVAAFFGYKWYKRRKK